MTMKKTKSDLIDDQIQRVLELENYAITKQTRTFLLSLPLSFPNIQPWYNHIL